MGLPDIIREKLLVRMLLMLLPAGAVPLLVFGTSAVLSHFASVREQSLAAHRLLAAVLATELDVDGGEALRLLNEVASRPLDPAAPAAARASLADVAVPGTYFRLLLLTPDMTVTTAVPPDRDVEGLRLAPLDLVVPSVGASTWSGIVTVDRFSPSVLGVRRLTGADGRSSGYVAVEVGLGAWAARVSRVMHGEPTLFGALLPLGPRGEPVLLSATTNAAVWSRIAALRVNGSDAPRQNLDGDDYQVTSLPLGWLHTRMVIAQPMSVLYAAPRRVLLGFGVVVVALAAGLAAAVLLLYRRMSRQLKDIEGGADALAAGRYDARLPAPFNDEVGQLVRSFNRMGDELQRTHTRTRILYRMVMEILTCNGLDGLMRKVVELACTQCQGEVAWFLPSRIGREVTFTGERVFIGNRPWVWKNHRSLELAPAEAATVWARVEGDQVLTFALKGVAGETGIMSVAYRKQPEEGALALLQSLVSLVDMALARQEQVTQAALVSTELEMAETIQRGIALDQALPPAAPVSPATTKRPGGLVATGFM